MPANLEKVESVEMYRLLEHGYIIKVFETNDVSISVVTPSDLIYVYRKVLEEAS
jgi:CMP-2-keto-3-deoxyoctulosonic acid synthetase